MAAERAEEPRPEGGSPGGERELLPREKKKADEEQSLDARTTYEVIKREGEQELERSNAALAWSGLAAGLSMGFSLVGEGVLHAALPDAPWRGLVAKLGYTFGFLIVIVGSQQLFTENTLTPIVPLLSKNSRVSVGNVLRLWSIVFVTNIVGTIAFAWVLARTTLFDADVHHAFETIGLDALRGTFWETALRGIFAGWLIALMVWMLPGAEGSKLLVIILIAWLVGAGRLSHVIAGSVDTQYLVARGLVSFGQYLGGFLVPTLLGNIFGGVTFVAALNHAQVVGDGS